MSLRDNVRGDENITAQARISKAAIILDWLSLPSVLIFLFIAVCLPVLISRYLSAEARSLLAEALGIENPDFSDFMANAGIVFSVSKFLKVFCGILLGLLIASWLIWAGVKTYLHFGYELLATDKRILVRSRVDVLSSPWEEVKNVFVGQSVWGRLFRYGTVTVHSARGALTVKYVTSPERFKQEFYCRSGDGFV